MLGPLLLLAQVAATRPAPAAAPTPTPAPTRSTAAAAPTPAAPRSVPVLGTSPQPAATAALVPAGPRTLADVARERKLNRKGGGGTLSATSTRGGARLPEAGAERPPASAASSADPSGGDAESYWRGRVQKLRGDLAEARAALQRASDQNTVVAFGKPGADYEIMMAARNAALTPYRVRVVELEEELARLPEECRTTSGCAPGWVR